MTVYVEKYVKAMAAKNNLPLSRGRETKGQQSVFPLFQHLKTTTTTATGTTMTDKEKVAAEEEEEETGQGLETSPDEPDVFMDFEDDSTLDQDQAEDIFDFQETRMATLLRTELDDRMSKGDQSRGNAPAGTTHMARYILSQFNHRKTKKQDESDEPKTEAYLQSQRRYRKFFAPGEITFTFPKEASTKLPSPHYHALQKTSYIHVDWEMSHPGTALHCYNCKKQEPSVEAKLVHDRTNFSKTWNLFPVFDQSGSIIWASVMVYVCSVCKTRYPGNDGRVLQMLDPPVRDAYPVHPRYAAEGATFHLTKKLSDDLDDSLLTYGNADYFCRKMHDRKLRAYEEKAINYYTCDKSSPHQDYIEMSDWIGDYPPDGKALRSLHETAEQSSLTVTGISNFQRHKLEIQMVGCLLVFAIDWTFAVIRNYFQSSAKACFTCMNENGEVCNLALVSTTKVEEVAHLVEQTRRRPNFKPKAIFTDTWPHNQDFWFMIFGAIKGCLGIFHFMKRIVDTLRPNHHKYWEAMIALKDAIYAYRREDYRKLLCSLKTGTMAKDKKCYTDQEINELRHSKKWKQRYAKFLRKMLNSGPDISQRLIQWRDSFANLVDPATGNKLFTADTHPSVENQIKHVEHIQFPDGVEMYREIRPGPRSTHNLSTYRSVNPEPMLESWHGRFAHMGNTGMNDMLADIIHLRGAAEGNVKVRHKLSMLDGGGGSAPTTTDKLLLPPAYLRDHPVLKDHCLGGVINDLAAKVGSKLPYQNLREIEEDNGEVFLSEYHREQMKRNVSLLDRPDARTKRCGCKSCGRNPVLILNEATERVAREKDAFDRVVTEMESFDISTGASQTLTLVSTKAQYVFREGSNVAVPITPIAPHPQIVPPSVQVHQHQFADNAICCMPFLEYEAQRKRNGKCKPGPKPHSRECRHYKKRKGKKK